MTTENLSHIKSQKGVPEKERSITLKKAETVPESLVVP